MDECWLVSRIWRETTNEIFSLTNLVLSCLVDFLLSTSSSAYLHTQHYIVESPPMGTEDLDNNFWWAEPLNRVKIVIEEGLPSGHSPKR
jgi:hypothetical protein